MTIFSEAKVAVDLDEGLRRSQGRLPVCEAIKIVEAHHGLLLPVIGFQGEGSEWYSERYLVPAFTGNSRTVTVDLKILNGFMTEFTVNLAFPHDQVQRT